MQKIPQLRAILIFAVCLIVISPNTINAEIPRKILGQLASEDFQIREKAYAQLRDWGQANRKVAPEQIYRIWYGTEQPEIKARCYELIKQLLWEREFGNGFIGISMQNADFLNIEEKILHQAVLVSAVMPKTSAEKYGLQAGDYIIQVDHLSLFEGQENNLGNRFGGFGQVGSSSIFSNYVISKKPGDKIKLKVYRGQKLKELEIKLMAKPEGAYHENEQAARHLRIKTFYKFWFADMEKKFKKEEL